MTDPNDPLAALSAAAKSRPSAAKPRVVAPRSAAKKPQSKPVARSVKGPRRKKSPTLMYLAMAAMGLLLVGGIIVAVVIMKPHDATPVTVKHERASAAPASGGPGDLFPKAKTEDPSK